MKKVTFLVVMLMAFAFINSQAAVAAPKAKANMSKTAVKPDQKPAPAAKKNATSAKPVNATKPVAKTTTTETKPAAVKQTAPAAKPEPKK